METIKPLGGKTTLGPSAAMQEEAVAFTLFRDGLREVGQIGGGIDGNVQSARMREVLVRYNPKLAGIFKELAHKFVQST